MVQYLSDDPGHDGDPAAQPGQQIEIAGTTDQDSGSDSGLGSRRLRGIAVLESLLVETGVAELPVEDCDLSLEQEGVTEHVEGEYPVG